MDVLITGTLLERGRNQHVRVDVSEAQLKRRRTREGSGAVATLEAQVQTSGRNE